MHTILCVDTAASVHRVLDTLRLQGLHMLYTQQGAEASKESTGATRQPQNLTQKQGESVVVCRAAAGRVG